MYDGRKIIVSKRVLAFSIIIFFCFNQNWLIQKNNIFGFLDEAISLYFVLYFIIHYDRATKSDKRIFNIGLIFIVYGLICNYIFGIQSHAIGILEDIFSIFKVIFVYLGFKCYLTKNKINKEELLHILEPLLKIYLLILILFVTVNLFRDIGVSNEYRYGIRDFAFYYGTPGHIINQMTYSLLILSSGKRFKHNYFWIGITLIIMASTLKTRAFLLILIYLSLIYLIVFRKKKRIGIQVILILAIVVLAGYSQFEYYFVTGLTATGNITPRRRFVLAAIEIAKRYFPLGTGFATFGSSAAADYYSPLYYQLGWNDFYGMSANSQDYLNDNYLPMIFVQFGTIAGAAFILFIAYFCIRIWINNNAVVVKLNNTKKNLNRAITLFYILDITLSSIQSSYLSHYSIVTLTLLYMLLYYQQQGQSNEH